LTTDEDLLHKQHILSLNRINIIASCKTCTIYKPAINVVECEQKNSVTQVHVMFYYHRKLNATYTQVYI